MRPLTRIDDAERDRPSVLHLIQTIGKADGMSTAVLTMVSAFRQGGLHAGVLTAMYEGAALHGSLAGVADMTVLRARGRSFASYPFGFIGILSQLATQVDIVHFHGLWRYPTLVGAPVLRRMGIPYVISPHGTLMPEALGRHALRKAIAYRLAEMRNLKGASLVFANGIGEAEALRELAPQLPQAILRLAVDTDVFRPADRPSHVDGNRRRQLLSVSRLHPIKRVVELVDAFGRVADRHSDWDLLIAGPEDDVGYRDKIKAMAAAAGISERVRLLGRLEGSGLVDQYRDADVFVLPSTSEGLGLSVVEALAVGMPVIATTGAPWAEVVAERCGWWVDPGVEALAGALDRAMNTSDDDRDQMAKRARGLALREYSLDALRGRLVETYREAIARSGLPRNGKTGT